jgi:serine/threonine-protein kinase RIO1
MFNKFISKVTSIIIDIGTRVGLFKYDDGFIIGEFKHLTKKHIDIINKAKKHNKKVIVLQVISGTVEELNYVINKDIILQETGCCTFNVRMANIKYYLHRSVNKSVYVFDSVIIGSNLSVNYTKGITKYYNLSNTNYGVINNLIKIKEYKKLKKVLNETYFNSISKNRDI